MAARLAKGKPDSALSIVDSAVGRSSVISGTTAGVTQFSEVSYIITALPACYPTSMS